MASKIPYNSMLVELKLSKRFAGLTERNGYYIDRSMTRRKRERVYRLWKFYELFKYRPNVTWIAPRDKKQFRAIQKSLGITFKGLRALPIVHGPNAKSIKFDSKQKSIIVNYKSGLRQIFVPVSDTQLKRDIKKELKESGSLESLSEYVNDWYINKITTIYNYYDNGNTVIRLSTPWGVIDNKQIKTTNDLDKFINQLVKMLESYIDDSQLEDSDEIALPFHFITGVTLFQHAKGFSQSDIHDVINKNLNRPKEKKRKPKRAR